MAQSLLLPTVMQSEVRPLDWSVCPHVTNIKSVCVYLGDPSAQGLGTFITLNDGNKKDINSTSANMTAVRLLSFTADDVISRVPGRIPLNVSI